MVISVKPRANVIYLPAPRSALSSTVRGDVEDTGNTALAPRAMHSVDDALPESSRFTVRHGGREVMFDHILASPALMALFEGPRPIMRVCPTS